jgi:serine/threonine-protein kinase
MSEAHPSAVQQAASGPDPLIGKTVNERFKIVALIARGGMGKVYRAEQAPLGRVCALKILNPNYAGDSDPEFHKRFFLEASIASKLTHPNTVTIFDYGRDEDIYYIAMEYLEGRTLHRAIREEAPFDEERAAHVARQICRALREAHSLGVIHRDLKPANIYLVEHADESDFVKVLDFGLVKNVDGNTEELTQAGLFMGSPKYMSPEQIRGDRVDARTDIYSLGIVLYEMVTGKVPFDRANSVNTLMAHVNEPPPPLRQMNPACSASGVLEEIIFKCIAKNPGDRFASMDEVLAALKKSGSGALTGTMMASSTGQFSAVSGHISEPSSPLNARNTTASGPQSGPASLSGQSQSGPLPNLGTALPTDQSDLAPKKSNKGVLLAVGGLLAVAAVAGIALSQNKADATPTQPSAPAATTSAPPQVPPPPTTPAASATASAAPAAPEKFSIRIESEPSGASVRLREKDGEEVCGATPCEVTLKGDDIAKGKELKVYLSKRGYQTDSKTFKVGDEKVSLKLSAAGGGGPAPGPRQPPPGGDSGFKPVPY